jgi:hypothetical protein
MWTSFRELLQWCRSTSLTEVVSGEGDPEGTVIARVGTLYLRKDGGSGTTLYVKESGDNTDTGWVAK